jgi:hypothetical protein
MADPLRYPEPKEDTGVGPDRGAASGTQRWKFVLGIVIAIGLVGVMVLLHLAGILGPGVH